MSICHKNFLGIKLEKGIANLKIKIKKYKYYE